ncbi:MAG: 4-carboxy-4-hydroxy-2-oxoadipate aldolase/oxaloacetate decarboxylase [Acidobacteria bacterium]|nr:4-carboxy-4-hydroxy-2-oxoadipate aldolase/oxaloacetate decarboxylase [Acidobacteriota bacterium]MBI3425428.1 4-carboxy-4-hydroxy-2-oxoadipate aldolase/oxaloacetate decarboxylase [Acidobacteriota bacterium]
MKHVIVKNIQRAAAEIIATLGAQGVATIHEAQGRTGLLNPYMRPIYTAARVAGSAITVSCQPGDNLMIHAALEVCRSGDVLVVTTTSASTDGMFGELLATSCQARGIRGLVIEAGVRDVADLTALNFPVWSKAISAQGTVKATAGSVNVEVVCAGAIIHPGDVVVGDVDGVVVIKREQAAAVAQLGQKRLEKEAQSRARLKAGELGVDFYGLRAKLKELGVEYIEGEIQNG